MGAYSGVLQWGPTSRECFGSPNVPRGAFGAVQILWASQMATMMKTHCEIKLTWPNDKLRLLFHSNAARTAWVHSGNGENGNSYSWLCSAAQNVEHTKLAGNSARKTVLRSSNSQ